MNKKENIAAMIREFVNSDNDASRLLAEVLAEFPEIFEALEKKRKRPILYGHQRWRLDFETKMEGRKSPLGPLLMVDHPLGWPYTDPNVECDC